MSKTDEPMPIIRMVVHAEADAGSSHIDLTIENADAVQLFGLADILRANANVALAGQMAHDAAQTQRSTIVPIRGGLPNEQRN